MKKLILKFYYLLLESCDFIKPPCFIKNPFKKYDLVIFDDIFPNPISGFRYAEFDAYLKYFESSKIITSSGSYKVLNQTDGQFYEDVYSYRRANPNTSAKLNILRRFNNINGNLFYCVFYNNIIGKIDTLNRLKIPFIFTLYPGGGFNLKNEEIIKNLRRVCQSPYFKGIIATQKITVEFLEKNQICSRDQINYLFGGIIPQHSINVQRQLFYGHNKKTLDICFCAAKYMEGGRDKGYDIFVETAYLLSQKYSEVHFHVIGGFNVNDIELNSLATKFTFYGYKKYEELQSIFLRMDFILSPNRPDTLHPGFFDGFPLGTVVEAALCGVIPLLTDELKQNDAFNNDEVFICQPNANSFFQQLEKLLIADLKVISSKVQRRFREIYSNDTQLVKRINFLKKHIN